ncbi:MAG: hypothetical protein WAN71_20060 [Mycobacterium sp.]|uniref:hypothetical protein n=1 Tax=Mycobacterium sp. TaxID=1785 RepID=UPI003BB02CEB
MALDDPVGSVADVLDTRRVLAAVVKAPRWIQPLAVVGGAAAMAALTGGGLTGSGFAIAVVIILATIYLPILVLVRQRRALGVRLRRRQRTKRRWLFTWLVFVVFVGTAYGLEWVLPLGTPLAYAVEFLAAAVILGIAMAVNTPDPVGNDAGRLVLAEDHPGEFDQLIATRSRLMLCTCLDAIEEIELGLLAHCLQQHPDALIADITKLAAAQYVWGQPDAGRLWTSLTPEGRIRYRRHLAALLAATA